MTRYGTCAKVNLEYMHNQIQRWEDFWMYTNSLHINVYSTWSLWLGWKIEEGFRRWKILGYCMILTAGDWPVKVGLFLL